MTKLDPKLLTAFARQSEEDPHYSAALAEEAEWTRWLEEGQPKVSGLAPDDAAALAARPLTVALAAKRERVSERTIMRWLKSGELQAHKVGREWRIPVEALDRRRVESMKPKPEPTKRRPRKRKAGTVTTGREWPA